MENQSLKETTGSPTFGRRKVRPRVCVIDGKQAIRKFLGEALEELGFIEHVFQAFVARFHRRGGGERRRWNEVLDARDLFCFVVLRKLRDVRRLFAAQPPRPGVDILA